MRKETIITAAVFFAVGFLAGYITDAQMNWSARQKAPATAVAPSDMPGGGGTPGAAAGGGTQGLPEGHPSIDSAAIVKQMEDLAAQNPKDSEVRLKLANFLYDQKQYQQSLEWYQKALELDPNNVNARTDLGTALFYSGRPQDALREYRKTLEIDPKHGPTLFNMIVVNLEGTHDLKAAQDAWERLNKINPNYPGLDTMKQRLSAAQTSGGSSSPR